MSRAHDYPAGGRSIAFYVCAGKRFTVMGAAIFERVQDAIELHDGDIESVDFGIEPAARGECRSRTHVDPGARRAHRYIIPVCRRAASDIID